VAADRLLQHAQHGNVGTALCGIFPTLAGGGRRRETAAHLIEQIEKLRDDAVQLALELVGECAIGAHGAGSELFRRDDCAVDCGARSRQRACARLGQADAVSLDDRAHGGTDRLRIVADEALLDRGGVVAATRQRRAE
jgi:hypothetical protein